MKQRLFSGLLASRSLGDDENQAVRYDVLAKSVRQPGKVCGTDSKEAQSVGFRLSCYAHVRAVRTFINFENSY